MISVEVELKSPGSKEELYDLRNYLQKNIEGLRLQVKETPPQEGQMDISLLVEPILVGAIEGMIKFVSEKSVEVLYNESIKPWIQRWIQGKKESSPESMEVISTLRQDSTKVHFLEEKDGGSFVMDQSRYAINTDRTRALLVGVGEFEGGFNSIPPVKGNLEDFCAILADKKRVGLPAENIFVSYNASQKEILKRMLEISQLPDTDTLIIYFTGHGYRSDIHKLYLLARDSEKINDDILSGVDFDFVKEKIVRPSPARQKILILDACHSGIATQGDGDMLTSIDVKGTYTMSSSASDEVSYFEKTNRNTNFTGVLLELLKKGDDSAGDMLSLEDLYELTRKKLRERKYPEPVVKSELNIPSSSFYISQNPLFSPEKLKQKARSLYQNRRIQEALEEYRLLVKKYPEDLKLRKEYEDCEIEVSVSGLMEKANEAYYTGHNYDEAAKLYYKAYQLRNDPILLDKIRACETKLGKPAKNFNDQTDLHQKTAFQEDPFETLSVTEKKKGADKTGESEQRRKRLRSKISIIVVAVVAISFIWWKYVQPSIQENHQKLGKLYYDNALTFYNAGNYEKSISILKQAVENGNTDALVKLGLMTFKGEGTPVDKQKAMEYYKEAADEGNAYGLNNLATYYMDGIAGISKDCKTAYDLLMKAKSIDDQAGIVFGNIGLIYERGCGGYVIQDKEKAIENYKIGASLNNSYCKDQLKRLNIPGY